jgi:hypothetical protein
MKQDLYEDPMYWLGASFFSGFLFSTWSWGILYLFTFLILWEIGYYIYCSCVKGLDDYYLMIRIGIVAGALMGFLIGRAITENDDHEKSIEEFWDTVNKYTNI